METLETRAEVARSRVSGFFVILKHTNNWPVETNPNSVEKPLYPYELEIDWMKYTPFKY